MFILELTCVVPWTSEAVLVLVIDAVGDMYLGSALPPCLIYVQG